MPTQKILIIRFSSIGDIIQCMSVVSGIHHRYPDAEIFWVTRKDMASLLKIDSRIHHIIEYDRNSGILAFLKLAFSFRKMDFTHVYDAHSNIRSNILKWILNPFGTGNINIITRRKDRFKRFLLFHLGINRFPQPFRSFESFRKPLKKWDIAHFPDDNQKLVFPSPVIEKVRMLLSPVEGKKWITLVPSAAWELKRWPVKYWQELVNLKQDYHFVVTGGPGDDFCEEIRATAPQRVINLAGKTSLFESFCLIYLSPYVISGDTGFLHAADLFGKPGQALIGPTAFGFPSGPSMKIMEVELSCRPCTKDGNVKCKNKVYKKCLIDITPHQVADSINN